MSIVAVSTPTDPLAPVKRKRGRPKKIDSLISDPTKTPTKSLPIPAVASVPVQVGGLSANGHITTPKKPPADDNSPKRKRGRPRKNPDDPPKKTTQTENSFSSTSSSSSYSSFSSSSSSSSSSSATRAALIGSLSASTDQMNILAFAAAEASTNPSLTNGTPQRKRGRPRKNPIDPPKKVKTLNGKRPGGPGRGHKKPKVPPSPSPVNGSHLPAVATTSTISPTKKTVAASPQKAAVDSRGGVSDELLYWNIVTTERSPGKRQIKPYDGIVPDTVRDDEPDTDFEEDTSNEDDSEDESSSDDYDDD